MGLVVLFSLISAGFAGIAVAGAVAGRWVVALAAAALAVWMASLVWSAVRRLSAARRLSGREQQKN